MCGIFGILNLNGEPLDVSLVSQATNTQRHRGPDDEGYVLLNTQTGRATSCGGPDTDPRLTLPLINTFEGEPIDLAFGFRRLSIQDLSPLGHQPMQSPDGRHWIVFNGEIYNFLELRAELISLGRRFHTNSDTEVLLAAYETWGESCLDRLNGMFVFAIWDTSTKTMFLARDRFGEKPLHYVYLPGRLFAFASEMKALWAARVVQREIDEETHDLYKYYNQLDCGEQTFYRDILRLPQAHCLRLSPAGLQKRRYWDLDPRLIDENRSDCWYTEKFRELFSDSIRLRLQAEVPVGASLSGGLDSSAIVFTMAQHLSEREAAKTFSARFDDPASDEGKWIDLVIGAARVDAHNVWPTGEGLFEDLSQLFWHQEEPFSSSSVYAQWSVMRLAKQRGVTVLLDGQGADETLAGYHSYFDVIADDLMKSLNLNSYRNWRKQCLELHGVAPGSPKRILIQSMPRTVKDVFKSVRQRMSGQGDIQPIRPEYPVEFKKVSGLRKLLWWNTTRQGLAELLRYADRNSMAFNREVRMPFLDHRLVEFVFTLPDACLHRHGWTKWILREAIKGTVPEPIRQRVDKLGYMPPQRRWLGRMVWEDIMLKHLGGSPAKPGPWEHALAATIATVLGQICVGS